MRPDQPLDLVLEAVDLALCFSSCEFARVSLHVDAANPQAPIDPQFFRQLLVLPTDDARDVQRPPMIELLCTHLRTQHPEANDVTVSYRTPTRVFNFDIL